MSSHHEPVGGRLYLVGAQRAEEGMKRGDRVQLHPATDRWMAGDRYGEVVQVSLRVARKRADGSRPWNSTYRYKVRLDKSGDELWFHERNILEVVE